MAADLGGPVWLPQRLTFSPPAPTFIVRKPPATLVADHCAPVTNPETLGQADNNHATSIHRMRSHLLLVAPTTTDSSLSGTRNQLPWYVFLLSVKLAQTLLAVRIMDSTYAPCLCFKFPRLSMLLCMIPAGYFRSQNNAHNTTQSGIAYPFLFFLLDKNIGLFAHA